MMNEPVDFKAWKRKQAERLRSRGDDGGADPRLRQNLAAALAVVVLLALAIWLFNVMRNLDNALGCLQQGRTNCSEIDVERRQASADTR